MAYLGGSFTPGVIRLDGSLSNHLIYLFRSEKDKKEKKEDEKDEKEVTETAEALDNWQKAGGPVVVAVES